MVSLQAETAAEVCGTLAEAGFLKDGELRSAFHPADEGSEQPSRSVFAIVGRADVQGRRAGISAYLHWEQGWHVVAADRVLGDALLDEDISFADATRVLDAVDRLEPPRGLRHVWKTAEGFVAEYPLSDNERQIVVASARLAVFSPSLTLERLDYRCPCGGCRTR